MKRNKKKRSIFWTTTLIILPLVLIADIIVLIAAYNHVRQTAYDEYKLDIQNAAEVTNVLLEDCDLKSQKEAEIDSAQLSELCDLLDMPYLYVLEIDEEAETIKYLAIGTGRNADYEISESRELGKVNPTKNIKFYHAVLHGENKEDYRHIKSKYADTLIWYVPRTGGTAKNEIVAAEISVAAVMKEINHGFGVTALLILLFTVATMAIFALIIHYRVQKPAKIISQKMISFVHDRKKGFDKLEVDGSKEFTDIASSFNTMTEDIDRYIDNIDELNRVKHISDAELNIARGIQMGLLLPGYVERDRYMIDAYIEPARDVGGDLYDYCELDGGKIFVAVADVSGKGISAALFMSRALTLLHQYALAEYTPSKILELFNHMLCQRNPEGLFITAFVAIYDPSTGMMTYSNAGHNIPYILSDQLIPLDQAHGVAAGLFDNESYEEAQIAVASESVLFLYTDGVNEAKNTDGAFYSTQRLEEKLAGCIASGSKSVLNDVRVDLDRFTEGAKQNDDITMLTLYIKEKQTHTDLTLLSEISELPKVKEAIFAQDIDEDHKRAIYLAAEEIFVNICSYAYDTPDKVGITIEEEEQGVGLTFTDGGKPFDPTGDVLDIEDYDHENAVDGLGRYLAFSVADRYQYQYSDSKNILYLYFRTSEGKEDDDQ